VKVAVFSDVHGNAVALEAVLADIKRHGVAQMAYGGDLAFGGPAPEACVARIRALGIPCVRGNTDEWFTESRRAPDDPLSEWTRAHLTPSSRTWLAALPFEHRIDDLLAVHATPWSVSDLVPRDADQAILRRVLTEARAAAVVYGHIHMGWIGQVPGMGLVVNTGSVGFPFDGDPRASYVVLTRNATGWTAELHRVAYDLDHALAFPADHPAAARWATMMRTGRRG
jgi:predicted phosphodiesterase